MESHFDIKTGIMTWKISANIGQFQNNDFPNRIANGYRARPNQFENRGFPDRIKDEFQARTNQIQNRGFADRMVDNETQQFRVQNQGRLSGRNHPEFTDRINQNNSQGRPKERGFPNRGYDYQSSFRPNQFSRPNPFNVANNFSNRNSQPQQPQHSEQLTGRSSKQMRNKIRRLKQKLKKSNQSRMEGRMKAHVKQTTNPIKTSVGRQMSTTLVKLESEDSYVPYVPML